MLSERARQCLRTPQKHPAIPIKVSRAQKLGRALRVRLLGKAAHMASIAGGERSRFYISVACLCARRLDSQHNNVFAGRSNLDAFTQYLAIAFGICNHMVGRKETDDRVWISALQNKSRESDCRRSVAANRL